MNDPKKVTPEGTILGVKTPFPNPKAGNPKKYNHNKITVSKSAGAGSEENRAEPYKDGSQNQSQDFSQKTGPVLENTDNRRTEEEGLDKEERHQRDVENLEQILCETKRTLKRDFPEKGHNFRHSFGDEEFSFTYTRPNEESSVLTVDQLGEDLSTIIKIRFREGEQPEVALPRFDNRYSEPELALMSIRYMETREKYTDIQPLLMKKVLFSVQDIVHKEFTFEEDDAFADTLVSGIMERPEGLSVNTAKKHEKNKPIDSPSKEEGDETLFKGGVNTANGNKKEVSGKYALKPEGPGRIINTGAVKVEKDADIRKDDAKDLALVVSAGSANSEEYERIITPEDLDDFPHYSRVEETIKDCFGLANEKAADQEHLDLNFLTHQYGTDLRIELFFLKENYSSGSDGRFNYLVLNHTEQEEGDMPRMFHRSMEFVDLGKRKTETKKTLGIFEKETVVPLKLANSEEDSYYNKGGIYVRSGAVLKTPNYIRIPQMMKGLRHDIEKREKGKILFHTTLEFADRLKQYLASKR